VAYQLSAPFRKPFKHCEQPAASLGWCPKR
jgi:hypothetical protein